jgi:hypothetical protein
MTRAAGKHGPRKPEVSDAEKAYIGADVEVPGPNPRDIPGGRTHIIEKVLPPPAKPAVQARKPQFRGIEAHGVEPEGDFWERPGHRGDAKSDYKPEYAKPKIPPVPVPVYMVQGPEWKRVRKLATVRRVTCPQAGQSPIEIGADSDKIISVKLLNEDSSNDVRFSHDLGGLAASTAALLPHGATSYLKIETQSSLWLAADGAHNPIVSVIIEQEIDAS